MKKSIISSKHQIIRTFLIFIIPFVAFFISYNTYTLRTLNKGLAETGQNLLNIYIGPVKTEIDDLQNSIVDIIANDSDFRQMMYSKQKHDKYAYMQKVSAKFQRIFTTNTATVGCIIYDKENDMIQEVYRDGSLYSYSDKEKFKEIMRQNIQEGVSRSGWLLEQVGDNSYLLRTFGIRDIYIMGLYDFNKALKPQDYKENNKDAFLFFVNEQMEAITSEEKVETCNLELQDREKGDYYISGSPYKYLIVQDSIEDYPFKVMYAAPYYGVIMSSNIVPILFMIALILLMLLLAVSFWMLGKKYLSPFQKLVDTMEAVKNGNMEAKMENENNILEFHILTDTFNEMMEEIKVLKISSYEYRIEMQQAKLQYLQIQIRPHFFLNCLKNLYGLAEEEKYEQIQRTILVLSEHMRYIMRNNFLMVSIEEEVKSVENYIVLQQLTSSYSISCNIEVEESLKDYEVPPLSILTFVENTIKHGTMANKPLQIQVKVSRWESEDEKFVSITILDNGKGFSEESLEELNRNEEYAYEDKHIGIQNVKHRFSIIYNQKVTFLFSNMTGSGACINIFIPQSEEAKIQK